MKQAAADPVAEAMSILRGNSRFDDDISDHPFRDAMHLFGEFLKQRDMLKHEGQQLHKYQRRK